MENNGKLMLRIPVETLCEAAQSKNFELTITSGEFKRLLLESNANILSGACELYLAAGYDTIKAFIKTTVADVYFITARGKRFENFLIARKEFKLAKLSLIISQEAAQAEEWMYE